ncbi:hypothetical protein [Spiroplasma turonicum]|uniref:Lipoprotein n=1 Tax=Spiroplasma turonicum TaxID=216946 RepID=A0A0K1P6W0_9MOLU|nr:hypothetical protein [Spiroplasma turonicum]AKU79954.1 hypothetical protein STURON_00708 [Spiroplasma turonicum]ALX70967.1 hypothetical protein STURO_v1c07080 [Spiroplasma turonicum]
MKKILSIVTSFALLSGSTSLVNNVVSCGDKNKVESFTYYKNKGDKDLVNLFTSKQSGTGDDNKPLQIENNLLSKSYENSQAKDYTQNDYNIHLSGYDGTNLFVAGYYKENASFCIDLEEIIVELKDLKKINDPINYYREYHTLSLFGNKGENNFNLFIYKVKMSGSKDSKDISYDFDKLYERNIKLS